MTMLNERPKLKEYPFEVTMKKYKAMEAEMMKQKEELINAAKVYVDVKVNEIKEEMDNSVNLPLIFSALDRHVPSEYAWRQLSVAGIQEYLIRLAEAAANGDLDSENTERILYTYYLSLYYHPLSTKSLSNERDALRKMIRHLMFADHKEKLGEELLDDLVSTCYDAYEMSEWINVTPAKVKEERFEFIKRLYVLGTMYSDAIYCLNRNFEHGVIETETLDLIAQLTYITYSDTSGSSYYGPQIASFMENLISDGINMEEKNPYAIVMKLIRLENWFQ